MSPSILIANGPNLNLLGRREPEIYGRVSLETIAKNCRDHGGSQGLRIDFFQTNDEGEMIESVHRAEVDHRGIILNAGAWTHTSVALLDALKACPLPVVEVHLSNIWRRESFRRRSYVAPAAHGCIAGFGPMSYRLAIDALAHILKREDPSPKREESPS